MSKQQYERTLNAVGLELSAVFGTVDVGTRNPSQLAVKVRRAQRTLERVTKQLDGIEPPKAAERPHRQLVVALKTLSSDLKLLGDAAASGYPRAIDEARARLSAPGRQVAAAIQQLQQAGFDVNRG